MIRNYRDLLYRYRRTFGRTIFLNELLSTTTDLTSGDTKPKYKQYIIRDAIMLPKNTAWAMFPHALLGMPKQFSDEVADCSFYIDKKVIIQLDWLIECDHVQYKVINIVPLDIFGHLVMVKATAASLIGLLAGVTEAVTVGETATGTTV